MRLVASTFLIIAFIGICQAQNGKLISKNLIQVSETKIWPKISNNNELIPEYIYLESLNLYRIKYESDKKVINGLIVEPKEEGKYPVVIFNRGGNRDFGALTIGTLVMLTSQLSAQGYVIIASNYRKEDEFGGAEINDVLSLTETVKEIDKADSNCIGMFGWSRGGMMTYLALKKSDNIHTAIVGNGPTDLFEGAKFRPKMETNVYSECIPKYWQNKETELKSRSVVYWADKLNKNSSLLILCGTMDKRVHPTQADKIVEKLEAINYDYELRKFKTDHFFNGYKKELDEMAIKWFNKRLKNES